jgi:hypothetical protein
MPIPDGRRGRGRVCFSSVGFSLEISVDTAGGKGNSSSGLKDGTPVKKYSKVVTSLSQYFDIQVSRIQL